MAATESSIAQVRPATSLKLILCVAAAGAIGTLLRFMIGELVPELHMKFPWTTFAVNLSGSALLGLLVGVAHARQHAAWVMPVLGTGLLGSYTTFSTVMMAAIPAVSGQSQLGVGLDSPPGILEIVAYLLISVVLCTAAAVGGIAVGRTLMGTQGRTPVESGVR